MGIDSIMPGVNVDRDTFSQKGVLLVHTYIEQKVMKNRWFT